MQREHSFDKSLTNNKLAAPYIAALSGLALFFAAGTAAPQVPAPGTEDPKIGRSTTAPITGGATARLIRSIRRM